MRDRVGGTGEVGQDSEKHKNNRKRDFWSLAVPWNQCAWLDSEEKKKSNSLYTQNVSQLRLRGGGRYDVVSASSGRGAGKGDQRITMCAL